MSDLTFVSVFFGAMAAENLVLSGMLGLDLFASAIRTWERAVKLGGAFVVVAVVGGAAAWAVDRWVLMPLGLESLRLLAWAVVLGLLTLALLAFALAKLPSLKKEMGGYLPLVAVNTAVLGLMLRASQSTESFGWTLLACAGSALGFLVVALIFSSLRERLVCATPPKAFAGIPILMIATALLCLAFSGFTGLRI